MTLPDVKKKIAEICKINYLFKKHLIKKKCYVPVYYKSGMIFYL
mgnify:CR=1 FL=1